MSIWVKICGTTSLADAELAFDNGADALGFVFAPSPRQVTPQQVAAIIPKLPQTVEKIGVFTDTAFDEIFSTVLLTGLTGVQLHFDAPLDLTAQLREQFGSDLRILRVVRFNPGIPDAAPALLEDPKADAVLVDSCSQSGAGGTGIAYDWNLAAENIFRSSAVRRFIAAGGLTADNVADAITVLRPWGVDVASGVESAPGRKDPAKIRAFIARARRAIGK